MGQDPVEYSDEPGLIARAQKGDGEAFRLLANFYGPRLSTYLARMLGDQESARDLVQETLLAAYRALPRWQPPAVSLKGAGEPGVEQRFLLQHPLSPWLYRIATNFALTYLKNRASLSTRSQAGGAHFQNQPSSMLDLEERYATRELLREALSRLSPEDATCLLLRFVGGERYAEIAVHLGISKEAARKRVGRGLASLRGVYRQLDMEVSP